MKPARTAPPGWRRGDGWGWTWGPADEVGALNALSDASRLDAVRRISRGRVFDLGVAIDGTSYLASAHVPTSVVSYRTSHGFLKSMLDDHGSEPAPDTVSFNTSMIVISDHAGTQIDGLCHATTGPDHHWYNGYTADEFGRDFGPTRAAADVIPPIIASGVLLDVPAALGLAELPPGHPISPDELQNALDRQGTAITPGTAVFVRTGAMRHWGVAGADHEAIRGPDTAGLTLAAARWLVEEQGAVFVGADNSTVEVTPSVDGGGGSPVHRYLLVEQGVHMGELHYLEDLAAERVYEFCYIALSSKVRGATAAFALRPVAVV